MVTRKSLKSKVEREDHIKEKPKTVVSRKAIKKNAQKIKNQARR